MTTDDLGPLMEQCKSLQTALHDVLRLEVGEEALSKVRKPREGEEAA